MMVQNFDEDSGLAFKPYTMKTYIGEASCYYWSTFPYTTIANPQRFILDWRLVSKRYYARVVDKIKTKKNLMQLSFNLTNDLIQIKMAEVVTGIDFIMGGHTHDGVRLFLLKCKW